MTGYIDFNYSKECFVYKSGSTECEVSNLTGNISNIGLPTINIEQNKQAILNNEFIILIYGLLFVCTIGPIFLYGLYKILGGE